MSLYSADTGSNTSLRKNLERTDCARISYMGTSAKLSGEISHLYYSYSLSIFFAEQSHCT